MRGTARWCVFASCLATGGAGWGAEVEAGCPPGAPAAPTVPVRVTSDRPGTSLFRVDQLATLITTHGYGALARFSRVCQAPCRADLEVSPDVAYYVDGPDMPASRTFTIGEPVGSLDVKSGSSTMVGLGAAAMLIGAVAIPTGGSLWGIGALQTRAAERMGHAAGPDGPTLTRAGMGTLIAGALLVAIGIPLVLAGRTHVTDSGGRRLARATRPRLTVDGLVF